MNAKLFNNLHLASCRPGLDAYGRVEDAALVVEGNKFLWVGARADVPAVYANLPCTDLGGCWVTPGLIDCHTHLVYAGNRAAEFEQRLQGVSYAEIARAGGGILATVRATRAADEAELLRQAEPRLRALLAEGVTVVEIKSGYGLDLDTEIRMLRVARRLAEMYPLTVKTTFLGAHAVPPEYRGRADEYLDWVCQQVMPAVAAEGLADAVDAFCEHIGFSAAQVERLFQAARRLGLPVKLHAEQLSDQGGAALAARYQALSADHLEYLDQRAIASMAAAGTVAVLLPGAFYYLRETKLPPLAALRAAGVPIAIATDCNPGSSPIASLQLMLNMACTLFALTPAEALLGVTRHAAQALGLAQSHGSVEAGKQADFAVWDIEHPAQLAYQIGVNPLRQVYRNGLAR